MPIELVPHGDDLRVGAGQQLVDEVGRRSRSYPFTGVDTYTGIHIKSHLVLIRVQGDFLLVSAIIRDSVFTVPTSEEAELLYKFITYVIKVNNV